MNRIKIWLLIFTLTSVSFAQGQRKLEIEVPLPVCYASNEIEKSFIPPPAFINLKSSAEKKSEIIVKYSLFPQKAKDAFEYAVNIWEHIIESDVPIYIQANWRPQGQNTLGSAGPSDYYTDFKNIPHKNRFYPVAIVEKITKTEITGSSSPDIVATFNEDIDWYFETDGDTPELLYDFVTVVLHEITHGLGFTGFFFVSNDLGNYGYEEFGEAAAFDLLVIKNNGDELVDTAIFKIESSELNDALISGSIYANSPSAIKKSNNYKPRLYSPSTWDDGSSIYHLNDLTYPGGTENALMTHAIGKGEANHNPGPISSGIMNDIGWKHMYLDLDKPKDIEEAKPIIFNVSIESDYELDTASLFVIYSFDSFANHIDTLPLLAADELNYFIAELSPNDKADNIHYYVSAKDTMNRIFTIPTEAPADLYSITIGPDNELPEISHSSIPYFLLNGESMAISITADDNLGVDTVYVEYSINGVQQISFGVPHDSSTVYSGFFDFDLEQLNDGDEITYNIIAKDSSLSQNIKKIPFKDVFTFKIEKIFDPVSGYINDFDEPTPDFILTDFDIYTETSFENAALHSPHPYASPEQNSLNYNYSTILKRPIILHESGTMTFDEIVLVEPGEYQSAFGDDDFWDYVIVEGSKDFGETWKQLSDGYDSDDYTTWKTNYNTEIIENNSQAVGIPEWYVNREIVLAGGDNFLAGDTILIRFRLFSDPYANGWGWAIDNLRIQLPVSSSTNTLSPGNIIVYPNPFNDIINVTVQTNKNIEILEFEVFNTFGQKVQKQLMKNSIGEISHKFNLADFADGMYFVSVKENGKQVYSRKIVKN
jgi:hypothetical protein